MIGLVANFVKVSIIGVSISFKNAKHRIPHPHVDTDKLRDQLQNVDIDTDTVLNVGQKVAAMTGHEELALALTIVREFTKEDGDKGSVAERVVVELLADHLDADQKADLMKWQGKLETVIRVGKRIPGVEDKINEKLAEVSDGRLNIDNLDEKIREILADATYEHHPALV